LNNPRHHYGTEKRRRWPRAAIWLVLVWPVIKRAVLCVAVLAPSPLIAEESRRLTVSEMVELAAEQRQPIDLVEASLVCADGLPGSENFNAEEYLRMAQDRTEKVRMQTQRGMELFRAHPERYSNSENRYKAEALISVLRNILKGSYEPAALPSQHLLPTGGGSRGPYISMPFLCLAVGRRLHYPLKLASAGDRLRLRWEGEEHFDLDWQSFNAPLEFQERTDEKPFPNFPREIEEDHSRPPAYLLSSADELSMLLNARGVCWESHGKNAEALVAYAQAHRLSPAHTSHIEAIARIMPKITPFFGHTAPLPAPDYSQRKEIGIELAHSNAKWDKLEMDYFAKRPPARNVEEQNEILRQRVEFRRRRVEAQNELLVRDEMQRIFPAPTEPTNRPHP